MPLFPHLPLIRRCEACKSCWTPTATKMRLCCPHCAEFLTVSPDVAGHRRRCPACQEWFRLDLMKESGQADHRVGPSPAAEVVTPPPMPFFVEIGDESSAYGSPRPSEEARSETRRPSPSHSSATWRPPPSQPNADWVIEDDEVDFEDEDDSFPVLVERDPPHYRSYDNHHSVLPALPYRLIFRMLHLTLFFGFPLFCLLVATGGDHVEYGILMLGAVSWLVPGIRIPARLANLAMSTFIHRIRCAGCGEVYPAVARWSCHCGYTSPRERNLFHFRCPICRDYIGRFNCPQCQSTIMVK